MFKSEIRFNGILWMWEPGELLELSLQPNWWGIPGKHFKPQLLEKQQNPTGRALPLKADGSPAASSLSYPAKITIKGQRALSVLPWSCSSAHCSTFGLSSSVLLISREQEQAEVSPGCHILPEPCPALLQWHCRCQAAPPPATHPWHIRAQTELTLLFLYFY